MADQNGLLSYRVTQLEKREDAHEEAVAQIRDAIISVREDSREIRNRLAAIEDRSKAHERRGEFRWTKLQVATAVAGVFIVLAFNFYFAVRK